MDFFSFYCVYDLHKTENDPLLKRERGFSSRKFPVMIERWSVLDFMSCIIIQTVIPGFANFNLLSSVKIEKTTPQSNIGGNF
jgi:hypothetical protein